MTTNKANLKDLNKEINSLKSNLKSINNDKERWFKNKEELKKEMLVLIEKVKIVQKENDPSKVDALKKERDRYNSEVKNLINKIRELKKEKESFLKKHGISEDPVNIKKSIEKIETKIETEVLSVDKERRLMVTIKRMKKDYEALGGIK